jgi:hypothetical protein
MPNSPRVISCPEGFDGLERTPIHRVQIRQHVDHPVDLGQAADGHVEELAQLAPATPRVAFRDVVCHRPG